MSSNNPEQNFLDSGEWIPFDLEMCRNSSKPHLQKFAEDFIRQMQLCVQHNCSKCRHGKIQDEEGNTITSPKGGETYELTCHHSYAMRFDEDDFDCNTPPKCIGFESK